jgi:uncharacterized protein
MNMSPLHLAVIFAAALIAGAINSIAGGGTILSFPALIFVGVPALVANATNTTALFPGSLSAYTQYRGQSGNPARYWLWLGVPSLVGGTIGAYGAITIGNQAFDKLAPWLVLVATTLFFLQEPIRRAVLKGKNEDLTETRSVPTLVGVMVFQLVVALYGGFFGAGIGILMLASLGFLGIRNIHKVNALKNFSAVFINGSASVMFALRREVNWPVALLMMVGAVVGGIIGARVAQRLTQKTVKNIVVVIGIASAILMIAKELLHS